MTIMDVAQPHAECWTLPGTEPESARAARKLVRATCIRWRLPQDTVDGAEMIVAELAANAIEHTQSRHIVVMAGLFDDSCLVVSVSDEGPRPDKPLTPAYASDDAEHGRGLQIVSHLSCLWLALSGTSGTCVCAGIEVKR